MAIKDDYRTTHLGTQYTLPVLSEKTYSICPSSSLRSEVFAFAGVSVSWKVAIFKLCFVGKICHFKISILEKTINKLDNVKIATIVHRVLQIVF